MPRNPRFQVVGVPQHVEGETLHDIREALNHELVPGRSHFKEKIEAITKRQTRLGSAGRPKVEESAVKYYCE